MPVRIWGAGIESSNKSKGGLIPVSLSPTARDGAYCVRVDWKSFTELESIVPVNKGSTIVKGYNKQCSIDKFRIYYSKSCPDSILDMTLYKEVDGNIFTCKIDVSELGEYYVLVTAVESDSELELVVMDDIISAQSISTWKTVFFTNMMSNGYSNDYMESIKSLRSGSTSWNTPSVVFLKDTFVTSGTMFGDSTSNMGTYYSLDGENWVRCNSGNYFKSLSTDKNCILGVCYYYSSDTSSVYGKICKSSDLGRTWEAKINGSRVCYGKGIFVVPVWDSNNSKCTVKYSIDGESFNDSIVLSGSNVEELFFDNDKFTILTQSRDIYVSQDGITWVKVGTSTLSGIKNLFYLPDGSLFGIYHPGNYYIQRYKSTDGGITWKYMNSKNYSTSSGEYNHHAKFRDKVLYGTHGASSAMQYSLDGYTYVAVSVDGSFRGSIDPWGAIVTNEY